MKRGGIESWPGATIGVRIIDIAGPWEWTVLFTDGRAVVGHAYTSERAWQLARLRYEEGVA